MRATAARVADFENGSISRYCLDPGVARGSHHFLDQRISGTVWPRQSTEQSGATGNAVSPPPLPPAGTRLRMYEFAATGDPFTGTTRMSGCWGPAEGGREVEASICLAPGLEGHCVNRKRDLRDCWDGSPIRSEIDSNNAAQALVGVAQETHGRLSGSL